MQGSKVTLDSSSADKLPLNCKKLSFYRPISYGELRQRHFEPRLDRIGEREECQQNISRYFTGILLRFTGSKIQRIVVDKLREETHNPEDR